MKLYESLKRDPKEMFRAEIENMFAPFKKEIFNNYFDHYIEAAHDLVKEYNTYLSNKNKIAEVERQSTDERKFLTWLYYAEKSGIISTPTALSKKMISKDGADLIPLADEYAKKQAEEDTQKIIEFYITRSFEKMKNILEDKDLIKIDLINGDSKGFMIEARFRFTFEDGSFDLKNQLVYVVNSNNTKFYRIPFTFHNVVLPDGQKKTKASLEEIEAAFLKDPLITNKNEIQAQELRKLGFYPNPNDWKFGISFGVQSAMRSARRGKDLSKIHPGAIFIISSETHGRIWKSEQITNINSSGKDYRITFPKEGIILDCVLYAKYEKLYFMFVKKVISPGKFN